MFLGDCENERPVQYKIYDIVRRHSSTGTNFNEDIAGGGDALLVDGNPGILMDLIQEDGQIRIDGWREIIELYIK